MEGSQDRYTYIMKPMEFECGGRVRYTYILVYGVTDEAEAIKYAEEHGFEQQRCRHSYDCCGQFYRDKPFVSKDVHSSDGVVVVSRSCENV